MTEAEWMACSDPWPMLEFLHGKASERKLRLFACACCRSIWHFFRGEDRSREVVLVSERYADGLATAAALKSARKGTGGCEREAGRPEAYGSARWASARAVGEVERLAIAPDERDKIVWGDGWTGTAECAPAPRRIRAQQEKGQAALLRDIFGNPFRPAVLDPSWLAWRDGAVRKMAHAIYDERRFGDLPILADALEDAGCADAAILAHCRGPGEHVRGCWVVDLLLGKD